jgi:hypothetical protein
LAILRHQAPKIVTESNRVNVKVFIKNNIYKVKNYSSKEISFFVILLCWGVLYAKYIPGLVINSTIVEKNNQEKITVAIGDNISLPVSLVHKTNGSSHSIAANAVIATGTALSRDPFIIRSLFRGNPST